MLRRLFIVFILISTLAVAGCKISGTITTADGEGVDGVTVYLDGEGEDGDGSIMAFTDANGKYVFEGFHHGTLTITPEESAEYTFSPDSQTVTVDFFENVLDVDFTAVVEKSELPSEMASEPWSTYQGNAAHNGNVPVYLNTIEFSVSWTRNIFEVAGLDPEMPEDAVFNPVAAGDGQVFVTTGDDYGPQVAMALDSTTGDTNWTHDFGESDPDDPTYILPPAYANFRVYIQSAGNGDSFLWTFDAASGDVIFDPPPAYESQYDRYYAPTIYEDKVYIGGGELGGVYGFGFDDVTGVESWFAKLTQSNQWTPAVNEDRVIAYNGYYRYGAVETSPPELTVIDRSSGLEEFSIPDLNFEFNWGMMNIAPVLGSEDNAIVINGGRLISFDLTGRRISWETRGEKDNIEEGFIGQPSLANGTIYAFYEGSLHARNESDGSFIWEWILPVESEDGNDGEGDDEEDSNDPFPMIVTDNLIFVSTASTTYTVDLDGQPLPWSYPAGGHLALGNDGILFIATTEGILHAISTIAVEEF